jgi:hypothetical protein
VSFFALQLAVPDTHGFQLLIGPTVSDLSDETNLASLDSLEELRIGTFPIKKLPPILRTITSNNLRSVQLFLQRGLNLEDPREWALVDWELCALADRLHSAQSLDCVSLEVRLVDDLEVAGLYLVRFVKERLPESQKHRYISLV